MVYLGLQSGRHGRRSLQSSTGSRSSSRQVPATRISDTLPRLYQPFFDELRRLGDVEEQNLTIERYSGEGRREGFVDLAREADRDPDAIVAITNPVAQAVRAASGTIPIVWIGGEPIEAGFATSLARPAATSPVTGYYLEIWGKRLQILKEAVPSASKAAFLAIRGAWEGAVLSG
ncbi:MAG: ABC transporter substrate binding protein [Stellaceae bacterium]